MSATLALYELLGISNQVVSKKESYFLEAELFIRICEELQEIFRHSYQKFFHIMHYTQEMENNMLETNFIRLIINDILTTEEYTLDGIANYTSVPTDVIYEVMTGTNSNPSAMLLRRLIGLHRNVRKELYENIAKKIIQDFSKKS